LSGLNNGLRPRIHLKLFENGGDMKFYSMKGNPQAASDFLIGKTVTCFDEVWRTSVSSHRPLTISALPDSFVKNSAGKTTCPAATILMAAAISVKLAEGNILQIRQHAKPRNMLLRFWGEQAS